MYIKNSSSKITGTTTIKENEIIIDNIGKPLLILTGDIVDKIKDNDMSEETLIFLYDNYTMSIGEIASLYNVCYSNINKLLKKSKNFNPNHAGRRNRAYGHEISEHQSKMMTKALTGRKPTNYERTDKIKEKISSGLKEYFKNNPQTGEKQRKCWVSGKYDSVDFKRGIAGFFTSIKNNSKFRFRSLLELFYMIKLEEDESTDSYKYEPFHIIMDNGKSYMPDFVVGNTMIELKSKKVMERVRGVKEKVYYCKEQAEKYCKEHNMDYKLVFDEDIDFDSRRMKRFLRDNPNIVKKYNITFFDEKRVVIK